MSDGGQGLFQTETCHAGMKVLLFSTPSKSQHALKKTLLVPEFKNGAMELI